MHFQARFTLDRLTNGIGVPRDRYGSSPEQHRAAEDILTRVGIKII